MRGEHLVAIGAIALVGCSHFEVGSPAYAPPSPEPQKLVRGGMGVLSRNQADYFKHLAWPQTYSDMKGTFGHAHSSTPTVDVYHIEGGWRSLGVLRRQSSHRL